MSKSDEQRLEDLEMLAAHQSRTIEELSDVVVDQGRTIASLRRKLDALTSQMEDLADAIPVDKPPHW